MPKTPPLLNADTGAAEAQMSNVGHFQLVGQTDEASMAQAIREDVATFERSSRMAAFVAIRVGLRLLWVRDNGAHGDIGKFIALHLHGIPRSSIYNYLKVAETFVIDAGLVDKKTHRLTNGQAVAPLLTEQLELFTDPQAKLEGALKKVVKWVGERGLSQIYRDIADDSEGSPRKTPPSGNKRTKKDEASKRDADEADARDFFNQLKTQMTATSWQWLDDTELDELRAIGATLHQECPKLVKHRNKKL